jgi:hypothetical protein
VILAAAAAIVARPRRTARVAAVARGTAAGVVALVLHSET